MAQENDDDGTVIRPAAAASTFAPTASSPRAFGDAQPIDDADDVLSLRVGSRLGEFEIMQRLGTGGFSIVYLARDHSLERTVALKEYLPSSLATRVGTTQVQPRPQHRDTFEAGLKSFINEARLLASFDHPSLVKVYRFWEAQGTAYMVMPFYQGRTLKETVRAMPEPPSEAWLRNVLTPLTEALMVIHADHCYHRDIAPDNVILLAGSAKPLLLDFGAARRVIGDMTQGLTVILKSGYAPIEQYAEVPGMKQGSWTDVYALAALVHWAIVGATPPPSVGRMFNDSFVPLAKRAGGRYSARFLEAVDRALIVRPEQRTRTIDAFRRDLGLAAGAAAVPVAPEHDVPDDATVIRPPDYRPTPTTTPPHRTSVEHAPVTDPFAVAGTAARAVDASPRRERTAAPRPASNDAAPAGARSRAPLVVALALGALAVMAATWWALQRPGTPPTVKAQQQPTRPPALTLPQTPAEQPTTTPPTQSAQPAPPSAVESNPLEQPSPTPAAQQPPTTSEQSAPIQPTPDKPAVRTDRTAPAPERAVPDQRPTKRAAPGTGAATSERAGTAPDNRAECARIFQRLSLGESNPELLERLKVLKCR
jgi:serine/threonine protein kinase